MDSFNSSDEFYLQRSLLDTEMGASDESDEGNLWEKSMFLHVIKKCSSVKVRIQIFCGSQFSVAGSSSFSSLPAINK
jgi:hypothetical protein